jgi:hypothetical protein
MAVDATTPVGSNSVTGAIRKAAQATGASFDYLLATAKVESDLDPNLTMRSSTATGLFQFIDQTWLSTLKQAGPAFGYSVYADAISRTPSGRYVVENAGLRNAVMGLRKDPTANALMGGAFTQQNAAVLAGRLGRTPSEGELYIGHFLGPSAAAKAITLASSNPTASAADIFPAAAQANRSIFYDQQGNARSIAGVCSELIRRYQSARTQAVPSASEMPRPPAAIPAVPAPAAPSAASPIQTPSALGYSADTGAADTGAAQPLATTNVTPAPGEGGMFHSLFLAGQRREAISPAISGLWSAPGKQQPPSPPVTGADASAPRTAAQGATFDLFRTDGK